MFYTMLTIAELTLGALMIMILHVPVVGLILTLVLVGILALHRRPWVAAPLIALIAFALLMPLAWAATDATTVDLSPFLQWVLGIVSTFISTMILVGVPILFARWKVAADAQTVAVVQTGLQAAAQFGINKVQQSLAGQVVPVNMHNAVITAATGYALQRIPDALTKKGITGQSLADAVLARLDLSGGTVTMAGQPTPPNPPVAKQA